MKAILKSVESDPFLDSRILSAVRRKLNIKCTVLYVGLRNSQASGELIHTPERSNGRGCLGSLGEGSEDVGRILWCGVGLHQNSAVL